MQIRRLARNIFFDLRYGAFLGGTTPTKYASLGSTNVANSDYEFLPSLFEGQVRADDVLVDIGCGKGRVLNWWVRCCPRNRLIGIELDRAIAEKTAFRLRRYPQVSIRAGNALDIFPDEGTLFYLFNPFNRQMLIKFISAFISSRKPGNAPRRILYYNCAYSDVFYSDARFDVRTIDVPPGAHLALLATEVLERYASSNLEQTIRGSLAHDL